MALGPDVLLSACLPAASASELLDPFPSAVCPCPSHMHPRAMSHGLPPVSATAARPHSPGFCSPYRVQRCQRGTKGHRINYAAQSTRSHTWNQKLSKTPINQQQSDCFPRARGQHFFRNATGNRNTPGTELSHAQQHEPESWCPAQRDGKQWYGVCLESPAVRGTKPHLAAVALRRHRYPGRAIGPPETSPRQGLSGGWEAGEAR